MGERSLVPCRWVGHRVDVCAVVGDGPVRFVARDVLKAADFDVDAVLPPEPDHVTGSWPGHAQAIAWTLEEARTALSGARGVRLVGELLAWLTDRERELAARDRLSDEVAPRPVAALPGVDPAAVAAPEPAPAQRTWTVAQAARILDGDPNIRMVRDSLFHWLHQHAWIDRSHDAWIPNPDLIAFGHLIRRDRHIPASTTLWPQVLITDRGLNAIHERLGGTADLNLDDHRLMLVEDGDRQ